MVGKGLLNRDLGRERTAYRERGTANRETGLLIGSLGGWEGGTANRELGREGNANRELGG